MISSKAKAAWIGHVVGDALPVNQPLPGLLDRRSAMRSMSRTGITVPPQLLFSNTHIVINPR